MNKLQHGSFDSDSPRLLIPEFQLAHPARSEGTEGKGDRPSVGPGLRILLVYDYPDSRKQIQQTLRATDLQNVELECVASQLLLQLKVTQHHYDVCLLDSIAVRTPLLTRSIRVRFNCPIIMLTRDSGNEVLNSLHCGAADCLIREQLTPSCLEETICAVVAEARVIEAQDKYERLYRGLVENTADVIYTMDLEGNYHSINQAGEKVTGYTREEIVSMSFRELIAPESIYFVWGSLVRMLENRKATSFDAEIVTKLGDRVFLHMSNHLIYRYGTPTGIQGIAHEGTRNESYRTVPLPYSFSEPTG